MPRVTAEHRAARREQILVAAMDCVAREGFHKTTMAHVVSASGLSAGAVYGYFRSKEELISAIADRAVGMVGGVFARAAGQEAVPSPAEVVERVAASIEAQAADHGVDITRVAVAAWAEAVRDEQVHTVVAAKVGQLRERCLEIIRLQQRAGLVDPGGDPHQMAQAMLALFPGFILQRLILGDVTSASLGAGVAGLTYGPAATPAADHTGGSS
ncbi:TetR/AcrR family transcriptional regulator [Ornithinicoccus halotolerans]|uniref:TetR/AcrR family transcriptional regulator n=1 Tax=Ornithinicoccus halotolerans TaxID=1748220 RepID=UPI00129701D0|nr:TetR/AcrR family transcriptional regulator [Ornithinicoccus halotolerans]